MALSDVIRATVYARDRAICSFSGLSLWTLDLGASPRVQNDWPDHKIPKSRGGSDLPTNLVCASHFYNSKKSSNGSDVDYLFSEGQPTEQFFWTHGIITEEQADILSRHQAITAVDWYFNRALYSISIALENKWQRSKVVRDMRYWQRAAQKRLRKWQEKASSEDADFHARGLVKFNKSPDVRLMLSLRDADLPHIEDICRQLYPFYAANAAALMAFAKATNDQKRRDAVYRAEDSGKVTEPTLHILRINSRRMLGEKYPSGV